MILLGVDTSTFLVSLGLVRDRRILGEVNWQGERRHLSKLLTWLDLLMREAGVELSQIEGIACVTGPGSFTALRIGLATMQGIALARNLPVASLSSLDMAAYSVLAPCTCAMVRSRGDVFFYAFYHGHRRVSEVKIAPLTEIVPLWPRDTVVVAPDLEQFQAQLAAQVLPVQSGIRYVKAVPSGVRVAQVGESLFARGETLSPELLNANYVQKPYTEEGKHGAND